MSLLNDDDRARMRELRRQIGLSAVVFGRPVTKKNSLRILRGRGGRPFVGQSFQSNAWEQTAIVQIRRQIDVTTFGGRLWPDECDGHVNLRALVYRDRAVGDLGNYLAAVCDALERAGVVENDRLIGGFDGSRLLVDRERPRVEIRLTPLPPDPPA